MAKKKVQRNLVCEECGNPYVGMWCDLFMPRTTPHKNKKFIRRRGVAICERCFDILDANPSFRVFRTRN